MSSFKVAILGATGETGGSIVDGLLESSTSFEVIALVRPSSLEKPQTITLKNRGINIIPYDVKNTIEQQSQALKGIDILITAVSLGSISDQIPMASAAKKAGVKRFVLSFYATAAPKGVIDIRDEKEEVLAYVKKLGLGYTVVDVGYWMNCFVPALPSGRTEYARLNMPGGANTLPGDGNVPTAMTDPEDVGRMIAQVVSDPRTLNKMVFIYGEVLTPNHAYDLVEKLSGERIERRYFKEGDLVAEIEAAHEAIAKGTADPYTSFKVHVLQYMFSYGVRGDNTPEFAEYLGYLNGKELYPDLKASSFEQFTKRLLDGKAKRLYTVSNYPTPSS